MISVLIPTRKRPENLKRVVESMRTTSSEVEVCCYIDTDDPGSSKMAWWLGINFTVEPRCVMSDMWNKLTSIASGDIFMLCADDVVFRTNGWDVMVEQAFAECPDKILMAYGDDLCGNGKEFATLPFVSRKWVETVGYFTPPGFSGDYSDTWLNDVAKMIGRSKPLPFVNEHLHPVWGKAPMDETYQEKLDRQGNIAELYNSRLAERQADAEKLRAVMHGD
jgi:hypothetical protein